MAKTEQNCCVLTLPLLTEPWQEHIIETRFRIMEQLKNALIAKELRKLENLKRTREWKRLMKSIRECEDDKERRELFKERTKMLKDAGFTEYRFGDDLIPMQKHFVEHFFANAAHRAASDVWRAFEKYLYGDGKLVRFHKRGTLNSIASKYPREGMLIDGNVFTWKGGRCENCVTLKIRIRYPKTEYEAEMLEKPVRNMRVVRKWMKTRYKYYLQVTLQGDPASKHRPVGKNRVGIDIGTQTIAWSSPTEVRLAELAAGIKRNHAEKTALQRKLDRSRRAANPQNYNPDGTVRRGIRLRWVKTKHYLRLEGRIRELERKNADIRKYEHICLANHILSLGNEVYIEDMNFKGLQGRAKETKLDKNGRYARKKRFGKSLANRAPSMFVTILGNKLKTAEGHLYTVNTRTFKASQYDHTADEYRKKTLGQRWNHLKNGDKIQRDLYSAFLLMNSSPTLEEPDKKLCRKTYPQFASLHDAEMERLNSESKPHLSSMGIR
ncbi:MAG: transposase [Clostridia bacterium]|nr:transposase [Clostridia bacterium]